MDDTMEQIRLTLRDAGCTQAEIAEALHACETAPDTLLRKLRICRCRRMEELHESQRRVDRLDNLIRQTQKQNTVTGGTKL